MGKIIAVANQKGGVGKTTTCVNLAASLVYYERNVLLVDIDPQGNATMGSGVNKHALTTSINDVLLDEADVTRCVFNTQAGYDIIPSNSDLTVAETALLEVNRREFRLLQALTKIRGAYDYVIIDCPPTLNMLTVNALVAATSILIPIQCEYYALEGLSALMQTLDTLRQKSNPSLQIEGLLRTMYDSRIRLAGEVSEQLFAHFGRQVYETVIPRNVRLAEAPSHGLPAYFYDKTSPGAVAYMALAKEILDRRGQEFSEISEEEVLVQEIEQSPSEY